MMRAFSYKRALAALKNGGVIACPTEAVYGLSCHPYNRAAVMRILELKGRSPSKGLLLVGSSVDQFQVLLNPLPIDVQTRIKSTWPGPVTWAVPVEQSFPAYLRGDHLSVAIRVSNHPCLQQLCHRFGPLVSTSANPQGKRPARNVLSVHKYFDEQLDYILNDSLGNLAKPTPILDALSGIAIRT